MNIQTKISAISLLSLSFFLFTSPLFAAAPDGLGPWADTVVSSAQGKMKNGLPVPAIRSNPNSALGVAENNTVEGNFFSLGFGGKITLGFQNGISSGVFVVEATNNPYPNEKAKVEISENGTTWVTAGQVTQDGSVNQPTSVKCAKFVRLTDVSNKNDFSDATADGYDVDGVKASGKACAKPKDDGHGHPGNGSSCTPTPSIKQTNNASIVNGVTVIQNTGDNTANKNKSTTIVTGDATTSIGISNVLNQNNTVGASNTK